MDRRGSDCDMDSELYQYFFATEFVDMFPQTNGDILLHFILVWIGSRKLTSIRTYRSMWRQLFWCQRWTLTSKYSVAIKGFSQWLSLKGIWSLVESLFWLPEEVIPGAKIQDSIPLHVLHPLFIRKCKIIRRIVLPKKYPIIINRECKHFTSSFLARN